MPRSCRGGGRPGRGVHVHVRCKQRLAALGAAHAAGLGTTIPETLRDVGCSIRGQLVEGESKKSTNQLIVQGGPRKTSYKWGEIIPLCWSELTPVTPFLAGHL